MKKRAKRIGSLCLSAVMALSSIPASSLAVTAAPQQDFETSNTREKTVNIAKDQSVIDGQQLSKATPDGFGYDIGNVFVKAGQANAKTVAPTVFNSVEITASTGLIKPSAAAQALLDASTFKKYERNFDYEAILTWGMEPGVLSWSFGKQDSESPVYTEDGQAVVEFYYDIADEATVKAIAQEYNLELKSDAEHGSYYEFPLGWDTEISGENDDYPQSYMIEDETGMPVRYDAATIDGNICVSVSAEITTTTSSTTSTNVTTTTKTTTTTQDVPKPQGYGWDIGKSFVKAGQSNAKAVAPTVFNSIEVTGNSGLIKPSAAAQALLDASTYKKYERNFDYEAILTWGMNPGTLGWSFGKQDSESAVYTEDGNTVVEFYYDIADEATVKTIAQEYGLELKTDAEHGSYYEFPLGWDTEIREHEDYAQNYVIEDETGTPVTLEAATIDGS
ncbi:MAG: hypothetical protein IJZ64_00210, partial [Ruminococcus sp.]|nr:hypothetical protein [Ruminococcus sp.]